MFLPDIDDLGPGSRVVLAVSDHEKMVDLVLACWDQELVFVPVDPLNRRLDWIADHAQASLVVKDNEIEYRGGFSPSPAGDAAIVYTSGSTGDPKGVVLTRASIEHNARAVAELHEFGPDSPHATALPLYHCNALFMSVFGTRFSQAPLVYIPGPFDPHGFMSAIERAGAMTAAVVPSLLERLVAAEVSLPRCLRYLITAAAPLSRSLAQRATNLWGNRRIVQGYGLSESTNFSFVMPPFLGTWEWTLRYLNATPQVGLSVEGVEGRIVAGEVQIRGDLMRCYWRNPKATEEALTEDGWLRTGDLGSFDKDGFLTLHGRKKDTILIGGETVYPSEVEELIPDAVVFAVDAGETEQIGVLVPPGAKVPNTLPKKWTPAVVVYGEAPRTSTGKPKRLELRSRYAALVIPQEAISRTERPSDSFGWGLPGESSPVVREAIGRLLRDHMEKAPSRGVESSVKASLMDLHEASVKSGDEVVVSFSKNKSAFALRTLDSLGLERLGVSTVRCGSTVVGGIAWGIVP